MNKIVFVNFFENIWIKINELIGKLNIDLIIHNFYSKYIASIPELFKWLLLGFTLMLLIIGLISFIKKTFKVVIVIGIIVALVFLFTKTG